MTMKYTSPQKAPTRASMTTEYQDRFLPPHCHMAVVSTTTQKNPYHSLKGTSADITTFRSYYVTHKWLKHPPKPPQASTPPKVQRRHNPARFIADKLTPKVDDYTSVYKNDFQAWDGNEHQPPGLSASSKVTQELAVSKGGNSQKDPAQVEVNSDSDPQKKERQPLDSITSYRSDYVAHPLPPRTQREKPVYQPKKGLPLNPTTSFRPKVTWNINQELFDGANEFLKHFNTWSIETRFQGQRKAQVSSPPTEKFLSTTHADYTTHKCQRTKPILPSVNSSEKSKEPFQALTTMREDYKAWDTPRHVPVRKEEMERKRNPLSLCGPVPADSLNSKTKEAADCNSNATEQHQRSAVKQAFSGFHSISSGNDESRTYWSTCVDRGVNWPDGDNCEEPSQTHQIISCTVSSKS
uniref:Uncharacterized protein n=1 Tax=Anabas testudineus TaxID=64144 RepID=A0AAQ6IHQ8_ANATE